MLSVLIVCSANICRSPMAEALLKHLISGRPDASQWNIASAGTWARFGTPAAVLSQAVMNERGLDISMHRSQPVTPELLPQFDLVLTMEGQHKEGLLLQYPIYANRIYMLSEMVGRSEDISDPIGGELEDYQAAAKKMERFLSSGLDKIYLLASKNAKEISSASVE